MLIIFKNDHTAENLNDVVRRVKDAGCEPHVLKGLYKVTINVLGDDSRLDPEDFKKLDGVGDVLTVMKPYRLVSREFKKEDTEIRVGPAVFGPKSFTVIAGPCAVESEEQMLRIARAVKGAGAKVVRGGAFKPRSSPYSFQGMGLDGLRLLQAAKAETGLPTITEAIDGPSLEQVYAHADIIQIGTRNMQNFSLLKEVGKLDKPVMLKRGMWATIDEWLMAAEYIMSGGNHRVILCERGIRSFDSEYTRNVVDLCAVPVVKGLSHLPVVIDPSHGTGRRDAVGPMSLASLAVGADAVMIDVHDQPKTAKCDGAQALAPEKLAEIVEKLGRVGAALGREL